MTLIEQITAQLVRRGKSQSVARKHAKSIPASKRRSFLGAVAKQGKAGTGLLGLPQGLALPGIAQAQITVTQSPSGQTKVVVQQQAIPKKRKSTKRKSTKKAAPKKMGLTTKKYVAASRRITALLKANKIPLRQGKGSYTDYTSGTTAQKAKKFVTMYKSALKQKGYRSSGAISDIGKMNQKRKSAGIQAKWKAASQKFQIAKKFPYYYTARRTIKPAIRAIPGTGATPFSRLSDRDQRRVVQYLNNTAVGQTMRGKGARKQVPLSIIRANRPTRSRKVGVAQTQGRFMISNAPAWERILAQKSMQQIRSQLKRKGYKGKLAGKGVNKQKLAKQLAKRL